MDLKKLREKSGLTQREVAMQLGYSSAQLVSNWERGICFAPTKSFKRLSKIFHISPKNLLELKFKRQRKIPAWENPFNDLKKRAKELLGRE